MRRRIAVGLLLALAATPVMATESVPAKAVPTPVATPAKKTEATKPGTVAKGTKHLHRHRQIAKAPVPGAMNGKTPATAAVKPPATVANPTK